MSKLCFIVKMILDKGGVRNHIPFLFITGFKTGRVCDPKQKYSAFLPIFSAT